MSASNSQSGHDRSFTRSTNGSTDNPQPSLLQQQHHLKPSISQSSSQPDSPLNTSDSYFEEAITRRSTPPSFLDNILNPSDTTTYDQLFPPQDDVDWPLPPLIRQRPRSPVLPSVSPYRPGSIAEQSHMSSRLPNGYVDLTSSSPAGAMPQPRRPSKRPMFPSTTRTMTARRTSNSDSAAGPSTKRIKQSNGTYTERAAASPEIDEIDLSDNKVPLQEALRKQREDAVKAQEHPEQKGLTLSNLTCVICMDNPTDVTATSCGHLFCHTCLMEALIAGENRSAPGEAKRSQCPICRKFINRSKASDIIPLLMKKGLATQPRKRRTPNVV
ncbi:hypothetical protein GQ43DRAFT_442195 [Delitschia confertaspora ATCC 74209]|uniref:RING-type domain-containing protein n=1 Tax=Delitschia confertaspora ATCC 74209 TaxID=1513339 RepID=A0A9P4JK40_9PLEO|nr:hypothetical protein GQ43DRAFT_442195 [Delitschia confertaspora ATCC 74209]